MGIRRRGMLPQSCSAVSDKARDEITMLANENPDMPIGVAFVDDQGRPGWIRTNPSLSVHHPSLRGCWPTIVGSARVELRRASVESQQGGGVNKLKR